MFLKPLRTIVLLALVGVISIVLPLGQAAHSCQDPKPLQHGVQFDRAVPDQADYWFARTQVLVIIQPLEPFENGLAEHHFESDCEGPGGWTPVNTIPVVFEMEPNDRLLVAGDFEYALIVDPSLADIL